MAIKPAVSKVVAVDWDARHVRLVLVRLKRSGMEALKAFSQPINPDVRVDDPTSLGAFIREVLDNAGISVRNAVIGIPREKVVVNMLATPPTPDDELAAIVQFQVTRELPFAAEESTLDFAVCKGAANASRDILWSAIRNDILAYYRSVAAAAGLKLDRIGLRPYANMLAMLPHSADAGADATMLVDVGPEMTEINVIVGGRLNFSRAASVQMPVGNVDPATRVDDSRIFTNPLADVEKLDPTTQTAVDDLLLEVTRSVGAFGATAGGAKIGRIVVAGATGVESAFAAMLTERIGAPSELFNPASVLDLAPSRARQLRGFSAALGLAMSVAREKIEQIDYLNPKKPVTRAAKQIRKAPMAVAACITLLAALFFVRQAALGTLETQAASYKKTLREQTKKNEDAKSLWEDGARVDRWLAPSRVWIDDLLRLSRGMFANKDRYVTNILMVADQNMITINMRTMDTRQTAELAKALNALGPYHVKIEPSSEQSGRDGFRFTEKLTVGLVPGFSPMADSDAAALALAIRTRVATQPDAAAPDVVDLPAAPDSNDDDPAAETGEKPAPSRRPAAGAAISRGADDNSVNNDAGAEVAGDSGPDVRHDPPPPIREAAPMPESSSDVSAPRPNPRASDAGARLDRRNNVSPATSPARSGRGPLPPPADHNQTAVETPDKTAQHEINNPEPPPADGKPPLPQQPAPAGHPFKRKTFVPGTPPASNVKPIDADGKEIVQPVGETHQQASAGQFDNVRTARSGLVRTPSARDAARRGDWTRPPRTKPPTDDRRAGRRNGPASRPSFPRKRSYEFKPTGGAGDSNTDSAGDGGQP